MPKWLAEQNAKKKKEDKTIVYKQKGTGSSNKSQSSSDKKTGTTTSRVDSKAKNSTFLGGGYSTKRTERRQTETVKRQSAKAQKVASQVAARSNTPQRMTDTGTRGKSTVTPRATAAQTQKMYGTTQPKLTSKAEADKKRESRRQLAQAQKSGNYAKRNTAIDKWDRDIADTVTHTIKQSLAADARMANIGMKGITDKDAFLYTTAEQRKKADKKVEERDKRLAKTIENETKAIEDIQNKHGYIGKQALSAVSSTTGMGMDIAAGAIIPGSSLFHMWTRSTGTAMGEVKKKADNLRKQLKATGQYSDDELDEMFRNVDAYDMANAAASGGIEVLSELLFPGMGAARKVIGGKGMSIAERAGAKLFNRVGEKASAGLLRNVLRGTGEEIMEEEIGGPLQALASNLIYGNRFQGYNEDAVKRSLADQSNVLRSQIRSDADAKAAAARLSSQSFMDESIKAYMDSGISKAEATELAELSREYLNASLTGDVDAMKKYQDEMVKRLAGGENSYKAKFGLQDAIDAAVSTAMMTVATGAPGALSTMQIGNSYKETVGLDAVKQQAEMILNWGEAKDRPKAQAIIDHIDKGGDLSGTQVYEIVQQAAEVAAESKKSEQAKHRLVQTEMRKRDLRINPFNPDGTLAPQTSRRYEQIVSDTLSRYESLAKAGYDTGFSVEDVELGADIGAAFKTGVISSEQINELARGSVATKTVFEDVTGIDIKQFDSYVEMRDALMAEASNNMLNSARLEQAAWNDEERGHMADYLSKGVGGTGDVAIQNALSKVDPRDRSKFILTGEASRRVYEYARNTDDSWEDVKHEFKGMFNGVDDTALKAVFDAAKEDKAIAETAYYGKVVKSGDAMKRSSVANATTAVVAGKFTDKRSNKEGNKSLAEESLLKSFVKAFGINIDVVDDIVEVRRDAEGNVVLDAEGNPVYSRDNGTFDPATNTLTLNAGADTTRTITQTAVHELTHHIAVHAPDEYVKLSRYIMDAWYKQDAEGFNRAIKSRQALHKVTWNEELSPEQALEEIIADGSADFNWADEDFIAEVTTKEPTLASKIIDAIKEVLRKIRNILASGDVIDPASQDALYAKAIELDTVRSMWVKAAQTARQAQADQAINEWQDNANEQSAEERHSPTTEKKDFVKGGNLSKELKDWAKEMGLDKLSSQPVKGPVIVSVRDLRTAWYEKNGRADEAQVINEALDKIGDSLTQLVGKYQYIDLGDALNAAVTYRTDAEGHPTSVILSCQVKNAEYEVNFDFTTICAKRLAMQKILERFIKTEGERQGTTLYDELKLDEEGLYKLRLILETAGFEVSCRGCFVEQNRYSQQNQARTIANDWNKALDEWAKDNGTEVTDNFGLTTLDINNLDYEEIEAGFERYHELMKGKKTDVATKNRMLIEASPFFRKRMNASDYASMSGQQALMAIGESKKGGTNLYGLLKRGQSDSKQSVPFTAYNGEISLLPDNMKGKSLYDYLLSIGGARAQSASDFQIEFVYDYMQMVADLSARGLPMHMYTKVIELAELFGMTGIKINLSAMCDVAEDLGGEYAGLKFIDGKYEYNISDQSIDYKKAVDLQKKDGYSKNIGIIMVTLSSQHMLKSLDDPDVRYIIGYHSSAMPVVVANMSNMGGATDYTKINKTNKLNEKGQALFDAAMKEAKGDTELEKYKNALRIFDEKIQEETAKKKTKPRRGNEYGAYMSAYGKNTADFNTYDNLLETKDARKTADKYLEHCMKNDLIPIYFPFAFHENYYKCEVYDFNMYDNNTGEYAPMESVQNIYPGLNMAAGETDTTAFTERVSQMMDAQNRVNKSLDSQYDAVFDEAKRELKHSIALTGDEYIDFDEADIDRTELTHRADAAKTNNIRHSIATTDSDGNELSEAQIEFFKDSKVRDGDGKLIRMYHGTYADEFYTFEPNEFIEEQSGLSRIKGYFSTSEDYSRVYGHTQPYYLNMKNPLYIPDNWKHLDEWKAWFAEQGVNGITFDSGIEMDDLKGYGFEDGTKGYALWDLFDAGSYWYGDGNLTEMIEAAGYDGIYWHEGEGWNIGGGRFVEGKPFAYMPFNQNAIKRADNLNPTENPDIRHSISSKDEVLNYIAQTVEDINDIPLKNYALEEIKQEYATSTDAFRSSYANEWNEKRRTYGKALDIESVKPSIIRMMKDIRKDAGTDKLYKTSTVDETLKSATDIFKRFKNNDPMGASWVAHLAAESIVKDIEYFDDDLYKQYKGISEYFADTKIAIPEELLYIQDVAEFVRDNDGRMRFFQDGASIKSVYDHLASEYPNLFSSAVTDPIDMLLDMDAVLTYLEPYKEAYYSTECADLVNAVTKQLLDIVDNEGEAYVTIADEVSKRMETRHEEAIRKTKVDRNKQVERQRARAELWKSRYNERVQKNKQERKERTEKAEHRKHFKRILKNYNTLCEWVLKPTKEKNVPEEFRKSLAEFLQTLDLQTEQSKKLEAKNGVAKKTLKMRELKDRLNALASKKASDGDYITNIFEPDSYIDYIMDNLTNRLDGRSIDELDALAIRDIDTMFAYIIKNIRRYKKVKTETRMADLSDVGGRGVEFLKAKVDRDGEYFKRNGLPGAVSTINTTALTPAYAFDRLGPIKEMYDAVRYTGFDTYIRNEKMIIDRLDGILGKFKKKNKKGQTLPGSEIEKWRDDRSAQTIELANGKEVTMSAAQMMSLYCLAKRGEQALGHMMVGGIVINPIQTGSKIQAGLEKTGIKRKTSSTQKHVLTYDDVQTIISKLTPDQKDVADKLQNLMSVDMAKLGNEAHRELYGYDMFEEDYYFPIKVHGNERSTDINTIGEVVEKIKSFGFAKPLTPRAGQAIEIDDIFSIVADHCNGMNLYNAYLVPITDFMKVFNYTHTFENGDVLTMKEAITQAYGEDMLKYILNLLKDINGIKAENRGGLEGLMNKAIGTAKRTAVFGNIRVALQQPTAIVRAAAEINPKYLKGVSIPSSASAYMPFLRITTKEMKEMWKYCPIAQWKAWGYYDTYMGKDIEDVMMNNFSISEDLLSGYYGQLDNATWAVIWQAVKAEQADLHKDMDHNSEEFLQLCGRRASEVFDKTQVVDSTFHRSDAMRNKQIAVKLFTAFMAEPTLTMNVFRAGLYNHSELKKSGDKAGANKALARAIVVVAAQAVLVAAAQAVADSWRGKDPGLPWGDDDEEKVDFWLRWTHNFVYNFFDQLHIENNMYLIKDITPYVNYVMSLGLDYYVGDDNTAVNVGRAIMGWDQDYLYSQNNLVFAGLENIADGMKKAFKKKEKGADYINPTTKEEITWYDINQKVASGIGTFTGIPVGTLMRDFKPIWDLIVPKVFAADMALMDQVANKMGYQKSGSGNADPDKTSDKPSKKEKKVESADIEAQLKDYEESLPDTYTDEQKKKLVKQYKKTLEAESAAESTSTETLSADDMHDSIRQSLDNFEYEWEKKSLKAAEKAAGKTGNARNEALWDVIGEGYTNAVDSGNMAVIQAMKDAFRENGGDVEWFEAKIVDKMKSSYKKTIGDGGNPVRQDYMYEYMTSHGVSDEEISDIAYHSYTTRDLKAAMRMGNEEYIMDELVPLVRAGLSREDYEKAYKYRNYGAKTYDGKYTDPKYAMSTGTFIWPVNGIITSKFGWRGYVGPGASRNHPAIDIGCPNGTPVSAADGGVVIYAGWNGGYGNSVGIRHDNGMVTYYNHLDGWNVNVGDRVSQGQQIANSGNTGTSFGGHLDFKVLDADGNPVDPEKYLDTSNARYDLDA